MRILMEECAAGPDDACYRAVNEIEAEPVPLQTARPHLEDMCWRTCAGGRAGTWDAAHRNGEILLVLFASRAAGVLVPR